MITAHFCRVMSVYSSTMNDRLSALVESLSDEERRRDRGAFFGSIYQTLEHIVFADRAWLTRFTGHDYRQGAMLGGPIAASFEELKAARAELDQTMIGWADQLDDAWLAGELSWKSGADGKLRTVPRALAVAHMFNHGTHHRGQITTLLSQIGLDSGVTDLAFLEPVIACAQGVPASLLQQ